MNFKFLLFAATAIAALVSVEGHCDVGEETYVGGDVVAVYENGCVQLICDDHNLALKKMDNCTCDLDVNRKTLKSQRVRIATHGKAKRRRCKMDGIITKNKQIIGDLVSEDQCFALKCKVKKSKAFAIPFYMDDCACKDHHEDEEDNDHNEEDDTHWSYEGEDGPEHWGDVFPLCDGPSQSPIDIVTASVEKLFFPPEVVSDPFVFTGYDVVPTTTSILNNGHTAQVTIETADVPYITGGGLGAEYQFLQYHYHWGADSNVGSEHTIDGQAYPMEVHLVHWNRNYDDVLSALEQPDGLAVLGFLFNVGREDNAAIASVVDALANVRNAGETAPVSVSRALQDYLGPDTSEYYRYPGSLTTPTCNPSVVWSVFKQPIEISESQLSAFRSLLQEDGSPMVNNFRPVQPLEDRVVKEFP